MVFLFKRKNNLKDGKEKRMLRFMKERQDIITTTEELKAFCEEISSYVSKIAPVLRLPGEEEMRALAEGALRALHDGDCKEYK